MLLEYHYLLRVLTPPPTVSPTMTLTNIYGADGCYLAVETPDQVFARHSVQIPATGQTIRATTPTPSTLTLAQRYIQKKLGKITDHVLDRMVMFYLPSARPRILTTSTTTIRPTTTTTTTKKPFVVSCPKPNGLFRHETDCRKYINCWKGRPHVQTCADGTLFSAALGTCDHAYKVDCHGN